MDLLSDTVEDKEGPSKRWEGVASPPPPEPRKRKDVLVGMADTETIKASKGGVGAK